MAKASVSIFYDKRRIKEGFYSVKLSVYYNDRQKLVPTGIIISEKDVEFLKKNKSGLSGRIRDEEQRNLWNQIYGDEYIDPITEQKKESLIHKALRIISDLEGKFSFESFQQLFNSNIKSGEDVQTDLLDALQTKINQLTEADQHGRAGIYQSARQSLIRFVLDAKITSKANPRVPFSMVTSDFMHRYERYMATKGKTYRKSPLLKPLSMTTIAFYTACFSAMLKKAVKQKVISQDDFPIGKENYIIPKGSKAKKALPTEIIRKVLSYTHKRTNRVFGRDMWLFSYLCSGMNISDICRLTWSNINDEGNQITFVRKKTRDGKGEKGLEVKVNMLPEAIRILNKYAVPKANEDDYVFEFLNRKMTEKERLYGITLTTNKVNMNMKLVAKDLGIKENLTTYVARHSFATTLARSEVPVAFISQALGHSNLLTTQIYLGSFEDAQTAKYLNNLLTGDESPTNETLLPV
jgi:integrase